MMQKIAPTGTTGYLLEGSTFQCKKEQAHPTLPQRDRHAGEGQPASLGGDSNSSSDPPPCGTLDDADVLIDRVTLTA
eukprot:1188700-Rhodomonas_salina.2